MALVACGSASVSAVEAPTTWQFNASLRACPGSRSGQAQCDALVSNRGALPNYMGLGAADLENAYKLPSTSKGKGASVFIVDAYDNPNVASDLAEYRSTMGLPKSEIQQIQPRRRNDGQLPAR